jgi:hypothetical protein
MPVLCPSDHTKEMAYRPTIEYLWAKIPSGAATMSGMTELTPIAGGSPAHKAHGQASLRALFEWMLMWPSFHWMVKVVSPRVTFFGTGTGRERASPH